MTMRFANEVVAEPVQPFRAALRAGESLTDASPLADTHLPMLGLIAGGRMRPRRALTHCTPVQPHRLALWSLHR